MFLHRRSQTFNWPWDILPARERRPQTRLVGLVGYFPEKYGKSVIGLALDILCNRHCPPAAFTLHRLVTKENVDRFYPNHKFLGIKNPDSLLFRAP